MSTRDGSVFAKIRAQGSASIRQARKSLAEKGSMAIFVILALISIAVLIAFLVMKLKGVNTNGVLIVGDPLKLYDMSSQVRVDASSIPPTVNGQEYSFSMWVYLVDFVSTDYPQLVFMRGSDSGTVARASPIVAFDSKTNKLYVSVRTNISKDATASNFFAKPSSTSPYYLTATIDYFPLQRWVNVIGVVKDSAVSVYMNASLYTVANVSELVTVTQTSRPVLSACVGNMYVGSHNVQEFRDPRGYITQFKFFNYAVTPTDITSIYASGPSSSSFFAKLGLAGYGLRSPVYRMDS